MPAVTPTSNDEVTYLSGVDGSGKVVTNTFSTLQGEASDATPSSNPTPSYVTDLSTAAKYGPTVAGTGSGIITYVFDPASGFTPAEEAVYVSSMALWSAVANVTFAAGTDYATAGLQLTRGSDQGAYQNYVNGQDKKVPVGGTTLADNGPARISIDTSVGGFGPIQSVNAANGYPASTVVHEVGHALGLGHGGGYNGQVNSATQQFSGYDTRLYSIMSYIPTTDTGAKFYGSYAVTGTDWGSYQAPQTPMSLDILAVQRLYGLPAATPLSGGQVFGYHSNITGSLASYFDFTKNSHPVLTLWDAGGNNTLDLSGYGTASRVNLNAGSYSSTNGLVNNIGIAFNTAINTAIGGAGDDSFTVNDAGDTIDGGGGTNSVSFSGNRADYMLARNGGGITVTKMSNNVTDQLTNIASLVFTDGTVAADSIACFAHGTLIATPQGEVPVEDIGIGDLVTTAGGAVRPVRWVGRRSYAGRFFRSNPGVRPVRIAAGALGGGLPRRDLRVSPEHAMFLSGVLVPASALVNGGSIVPDLGCDRVDYVHLELDSHDVILAEGAATETFLDDDSRAMFANAAEYSALYGAGLASGRFCARRVDRGFALQAVLDTLPSPAAAA